MEEETEYQDSQTLADDQTDTGYEEESNDSESTDDIQAQLEAERAKNAKLYARLKKAEKKPSESNKPQTQSSLTADEARLIAKGYDDETIEQAKIIQAGLKAQGKEVPLTKVSEMEIFASWLEKKDLEAKRAKAQLGASGSATTHADKPVGEMTEAEHRAYFNKLSNG